MTINRYRYFYACAFSMFEGHLVAFMLPRQMRAAGIAACDLDETRAIELVAAMGWIYGYGADGTRTQPQQRDIIPTQAGSESRRWKRCPATQAGPLIRTRSCEDCSA